jgi:hypothetical protein
MMSTRRQLTFEGSLIDGLQEAEPKHVVDFKKSPDDRPGEMLFE